MDSSRLLILELFVVQEADLAKEPGTGPVSRSAEAPRVASLVSQRIQQKSMIC